MRPNSDEKESLLLGIWREYKLIIPLRANGSSLFEPWSRVHPNQVPMNLSLPFRAETPAGPPRAAFGPADHLRSRPNFNCAILALALIGLPGFLCRGAQIDASGTWSLTSQCPIATIIWTTPGGLPDPEQRDLNPYAAVASPVYQTPDGGLLIPDVSPMAFTGHVSGTSISLYKVTSWATSNGSYTGTATVRALHNGVVSGHNIAGSVTISFEENGFDGRRSWHAQGSTTGPFSGFINGTPLFLLQPTAQVAALGQAVTFTVVAYGSQPLNYQWFKNTAPLTDGLNVSGAQAPALTLANIQVADAGNYRVVVSNSVGSTTSQPATLTLSSGAAYRVLHHFTGYDGRRPVGPLLISSNTLCGAASAGCADYDPPYLWGSGGLFRMALDGSDFRLLKQLGEIEGETPLAGLTTDGTTLYGTAQAAGIDGHGTLFQIDPEGTNFTVLKSFASGPGGANPRTGLVLSANKLYGTTYAGGNGYGVVFSIGTDGSGYTVLQRFSGTNGSYPQGGLLLIGSTLYGTTSGTGSDNAGTVFKVNTDSTGFAVLKVFSTSQTDGTAPQADLLLIGPTLYGTTCEGGLFNCGTIFSMGTNGSGFRVLKHFTLADGSHSRAGLLSVGNSLLGTTYFGGASNYGTIFKIGMDGNAYTVLKHFTGTDGAEPTGTLILSGTTLYGTTAMGGAYDSGVLFAMPVPFPVILRPPASQTAEAGSTAEFRVAAGGLAPLTCLWYFNNSQLISSGPDCRLRLANLQLTNAGTYTAVVTNTSGVVISSPAMLQVIAPVPRRPVAALHLTGQTGTTLRLDYADAFSPAPAWYELDSRVLTNSPQIFIDAASLRPRRFYRSSQPGMPSVIPALALQLVPAIALTGNIGDVFRLDYINRYGPVDAWLTLDTVTLTNTSQLYFDTSAPGQPERLYRLSQVP